MPETSRLVTAEELEKFPRNDHRYELVEGRVIPLSPAIGFLLSRYLRSQPVGVVVTCDPGLSLWPPRDLRIARSSG